MRKLILFVGIVAIAISSCGSQANGKFVNDDIVIVNTGIINRGYIAHTIEIINSMNPKVIAIDLQFPDTKDFYKDSLLASSLKKCKNLVMACMIGNYSGEDLGYDDMIRPVSQFSTNAKIGFINALLEPDSFHTLKRFSIREQVNGSPVYHFGILVAMSFDSLKTMLFIRNKPRIIDVDYKGGDKNFRTISYEDVLENKLKRNDIEGKIVLLGFLELHKNYTGKYDEDKFFTPLNDKKQPYKPDMHGVTYLANIINQVLRNN